MLVTLTSNHPKGRGRERERGGEGIGQTTLSRRGGHCKASLAEQPKEQVESPDANEDPLAEINIEN